MTAVATDDGGAPDSMSTADAAAELGLTSRALFRLVDRGELEVFREGRVLRVPVRSLAEYQSRHQR